jgi:glycosyltransferase involved in cell wall biosynthesis
VPDAPTPGAQHLLSVAVRAHVVDPSAYTPPYDHALCSALAEAGVEVELYTSHFAYGPVAPAEGYVRRESFYRGAVRVRAPRLRRAAKLIEHVPDMLRYRRSALAADVVHFQWLTVQHLDSRLLPRGRPLVRTAHDILPREPRLGQREAQRRLYERFDAVVTHSAHGAARLTRELGVDARRVHVIPHGAFAHLASGGAKELPASLRSERPVVLCFGLMRPYKGIDLLIEAWRGIEDAELWIAGMPRMDISALVAGAPANVRFVPRFIGDDELPAYFRRADLVVLPYREIDQSGVLFTALAFGKPLLLSDVGGFPEIAAAGAARTFPAGQAAPLHEALVELLGSRAALAQLAEGAARAAGGPYSWSATGRLTRELYEALVRERACA